LTVKKRILIIGGGRIGRVGGVNTHVNHLQKILRSRSTELKVIGSYSFLNMLKERLFFQPNVIIYNLPVYRNQIIRHIIARLIMTSRIGKNVLHLHGGQFSNVNLAENPVWKTFLKFNMRRFDRIFCLTDEQYEYLSNCLDSQKNISKIYNYVDIPDRFQLDKDDVCLNLLYIGRLHPQKGIRQAVSAIQQLRENKIRFWIIGAGELEKELADIKDARIVFLGKKFGGEKNSYLSRAHIFLLPTSWPEGMPYALLEAASYGLALIATPVGAINQLLFHGKNGFFVEAKNVAMIARTLHIFLTDRALTLQMGRESRKICEEHFPLRKLQEIYDGLFAKWKF